jgi:hypothetical protein
MLMVMTERADDGSGGSPGGAGLDELISRYLSPAVEVHREDSTVETVVDGRAWMRRMRELLTSLGPGDAAYICGLLLDPDLDLLGRQPSEQGYEPLGELLAGLAAAGVDVRVMLAELNAAMVTTGNDVRDLRVRLWAEHLRTPLNPALRAALDDLDLALGIFRPEWLPPNAPAGTWRQPGIPAGFAPTELVLNLVGPP